MFVDIHPVNSLLKMLPSPMKIGVFLIKVGCILGPILVFKAANVYVNIHPVNSLLKMAFC